MSRRAVVGPHRIEFSVIAAFEQHANRRSVGIDVRAFSHHRDVAGRTHVECVRAVRHLWKREPASGVRTRVKCRSVAERGDLRVLDRCARGREYLAAQAVVLDRLRRDLRLTASGQIVDSYLLYVGPFNSQADARARCSAPPSLGSTCIVVKPSP